MADPIPDEAIDAKVNQLRIENRTHRRPTWSGLSQTVSPARRQHVRRDGAVALFPVWAPRRRLVFVGPAHRFCDRGRLHVLTLAHIHGIPMHDG